MYEVEYEANALKHLINSIDRFEGLLRRANEDGGIYGFIAACFKAIAEPIHY